MAPRLSDLAHRPGGGRTDGCGADAMDLRVSVSREDEATVLHVDGRLAVDGVRDLNRTVEATRDPVILDLTNLLSADDAGVVALRLLTMRDSVRLRGASPYIALLLREDP